MDTNQKGIHTSASSKPKPYKHEPEPEQNRTSMNLNLNIPPKAGSRKQRTRASISKEGRAFPDEIRRKKPQTAGQANTGNLNMYQEITKQSNESTSNLAD